MHIQLVLLQVLVDDLKGFVSIFGLMIGKGIQDC